MRFLSLIPALLIVFSGFLCSCDDSGDNSGWNSGNNTTNNNNQPDGGVDSSFRVTEVDPDHGPVTGGGQVTIRGFGFDKYTRIFFDGIWADPSQTIYIAPNRMMVTVPAGVVGPAQVTAQRNDGVQTHLIDGYNYDQFSMDPASGSMSGGTFVRISSPLLAFESTDRIFLGDTEITDFNLVSSGLIVATTPPHSPAKVTFSLEKADGTRLTTLKAFEYYDTTDPAYGGMDGTPIDGSLTVTVLDAYGHTPIEGAYVLLGADVNSPFKGLTDPNGQVTFSSADLRGRQMLSVAFEAYEIVSFVGFDSSEVTVFLTPIDPPSNPTGGIPGVPDNVYAQVSGSLIFLDEEFNYSCNWKIQVPGPVPAGYERVAKIYQSLGYYDTMAPEVYILRENTSTCIEGFGYPFALTLWPGAFALYSIAGFQSLDGSNFIPKSYGIVRHLVIGPGEIRQARIKVENILQRTVSVNLVNPPPIDPQNGPFGYKTKLIMNLGADGYILREDSIISTTATGLLVFSNQMDLKAELADATFALYSEAHSMGAYPFSQVY
ncbi:IPT/TIG domain-containing protein, partial [Myxococcota bacterium]|nr:IPT/TIG domain-containing protein [Myxococcota bacterium]